MSRKFECTFCNHASQSQHSHHKHLCEKHSDVAPKCQVCGEYLWTVRALMNHVSRSHQETTKEEYWSKHVYGSPICPLSKDTNQPLTYSQYTTNRGYTHLLNYNRKNKSTAANFVCELDGIGFSTKGELSRHIAVTYPEVDLEKYYLEHFWKEGDPSGKCLWCGKSVKFRNLSKGYDKFCHNSCCNVNYYNKHTGRQNCGDKIGKAIKENQNSQNQVGYWVKKGYTEEQAKALIKERQTTNSIEKIMKREKCSRKEAEKIRQDITKKWLDSFHKQNFSKVSQELFWEVYNRFNKGNCDVFFATNNNGVRDENKNYEYRLKTTNTFRMLDFYVPQKNKIIEFDGTYWHGVVGRGNKSSDAKRDEEIIRTLGSKILHINENDYKSNKEKTIQKCLEFLND